MRGAAQGIEVAGRNGRLDTGNAGVGGFQESLKKFAGEVQTAAIIELAQQFHGRQIDDRRRLRRGRIDRHASRPGFRRWRHGKRSARPGRQPACEHRTQRKHGVGLGQKRIHAGIETALFITRHGVGSHGDDRQFCTASLRQATDMNGRLQAIHHRHLAIHQHQIKVMAAHQVDRLRAIARHLPIDA